jgi:preprotein translocase subunit SecD
MNRYPLWKYILIARAAAWRCTRRPTTFVDSPALQVTTGKATVKINSDTTSRVADALKRDGIPAEPVSLEGSGDSDAVRARFATTDAQFKAKLALERDLNRDQADPDYIVTVNLVKNTPAWMQAGRAADEPRPGPARRRALPAAGRRQGGARKPRSRASRRPRSMLRDKNVRHAGIERVGNTVEITLPRCRDPRQGAQRAGQPEPDLATADAADGTDLKLVVTLKPEALQRTVEEGVKQNITTLSKRINELGVTEPVIQQQGADRIVVQLPGVQDVAHAKDIIGRTATLELRMVDDTVTPGTELTAAIPLNSELFTEGRGAPVVVSKDVFLTGDYISSAVATFDQNQQPAVSARPERRRRPQDARHDPRARRQAHGRSC